MRSLLLLGILLAVPFRAHGQVERFEVGQRLRAFETAWDLRKPNDGIKLRVSVPLANAMQAFFSFRLGEAARSLDEARWLLESEKPAPFEIQWADSLAVQPASRLIDAQRKELEVVIKPFYEVKGAIPAKTTVRLRLGPGEALETTLDKLPKNVLLPTLSIPVPKNLDLDLEAEIRIDGKTVATKKMTVSRVQYLEKRLENLASAANSLSKETSLETATLKSLNTLLTHLSEGTVKETNYPAARLLKEAEAVTIAASMKNSYYGPQRAGQFWLTVPTDKSTETVRIQVPEKMNPEKKVPILVALHGAGGSENLFFDGYGDGITAKMCQERGWLMVTTNAGLLGFGTTPPVLKIVESLAKRYPIDTGRIFVVGHSMGAAHAISLANSTPERFAAIAVLGGAGTLRNTTGAKSLPIFIGCGSKDFALRGAKNLSEAVQKAKLEKVQFKEYENIEHMVIVREAMADVFSFFEKAK